MKMNEEATLPSLDLGNMGECLQIFSDVSEKVCFKCSKPVHISAFCRAKPKTVSQETSSWARIVDRKLPSNPSISIPAVEAPEADTVDVPDPGSASNGDALSSQTVRSSTPSNVRLDLTSPHQVTGNKPSSSTTGVDMPILAAGSSSLSSVKPLGRSWVEKSLQQAISPKENGELISKGIFFKPTTLTHWPINKPFCMLIANV